MDHTSSLVAADQVDYVGDARLSTRLLRSNASASSSGLLSSHFCPSQSRRRSHSTCLPGAAIRLPEGAAEVYLPCPGRFSQPLGAKSVLACLGMAFARSPAPDGAARSCGLRDGMVGDRRIAPRATHTGRPLACAEVVGLDGTHAATLRRPHVCHASKHVFGRQGPGVCHAASAGFTADCCSALLDILAFYTSLRSQTPTEVFLRGSIVFRQASKNIFFHNFGAKDSGLLWCLGCQGIDATRGPEIVASLARSLTLLLPFFRHLCSCHQPSSCIHMGIAHVLARASRMCAARQGLACVLAPCSLTAAGVFLAGRGCLGHVPS